MGEFYRRMTKQTKKRVRQKCTCVLPTYVTMNKHHQTQNKTKHYSLWPKRQKVGVKDGVRNNPMDCFTSPKTKQFLKALQSHQFCHSLLVRRSPLQTKEICICRLLHSEQWCIDESAVYAHYIICFGQISLLSLLNCPVTLDGHFHSRQSVRHCRLLFVVASGLNKRHVTDYM